LRYDMKHDKNLEKNRENTLTEKISKSNFQLLILLSLSQSNLLLSFYSKKNLKKYSTNV
jgi:hypothetical protein